MPFSTFGLHADVLRGVKDLAYTTPTPVQAAAIRPAAEGRDVLACASTGSGKTAAFLLPLLHRLASQPRQHGGVPAPRALILTPTRELAAQILENFRTFAAHMKLSAAAIIGGVSMGPQAHALRTGVDVLIATPGRLLDHLRHPYARLGGLEVLVLDEADRMLDMGFLPDVRRILNHVPKRRQTMLFSATMPPEVRHLVDEMLHDPVRIQTERQSAPATAISQTIFPVPQHLKTSLLCRLLQGPELASVICFTRTKRRANQLARTLEARGFSCAPIHGNRSQGQRTAALSGFKDGRFRVLIATDIAARGIDVADISHVVNFDCPHLADDYIHRVGRTGRASASGDAFTFVSDDEQGNLKAIERALGKRLPRVTLPDFDYAKKAEQKEMAHPARGPARGHKGNAPHRPSHAPEKGLHASAAPGRSHNAGGDRHGSGPSNTGSAGPGSRQQAQSGGGGRGKFGHPRVRGRYKGPAQRPR